MNTQKSKWVFAEGALGQHEVLVARKALRDVEVALEFAHRSWRTWVLNRDAGNLTTHALHNEGARWRRMIRDLRQDLRKAQEHYFSVATITPALPGEPGLEVECPFKYMQADALNEMLKCGRSALKREGFIPAGEGRWSHPTHGELPEGDALTYVDSKELDQAQHAYLTASGWVTERMADDSLRYKYLSNYSMVKKQALHVEMQRTRTMADPTLVEEMHAAERQMLLDCGWVEQGSDQWIDASSEKEVKVPKEFGYAVNIVESDNERFAERRKHTRALVREKRIAYLLGNGWTCSELHPHFIDPSTGRTYAFKKAVNRQKFFTHQKRVGRVAATPAQREVVTAIMHAEDKYLLERGWVRLIRGQYYSWTFRAAHFRPNAVQLQLVLDASAKAQHEELATAQAAYLTEHKWRQLENKKWRLHRERSCTLAMAVAAQQFRQWQYNRFVGGVQ